MLVISLNSNPSAAETVSACHAGVMLIALLHATQLFRPNCDFISAAIVTVVAAHLLSSSTTATPTMLAFAQLPPELISNVLGFVDPEDLAQVKLTCRYLYHTVQGNAALFRAIYLRHLVSTCSQITTNIPEQLLTWGPKPKRMIPALPTWTGPRKSTISSG